MKDNVSPIQEKFARTVERGGRSIQIRPDALHLIASEAERALVDADTQFFVRGGIVKPVVDELPASHGRYDKVARLCEVDAECMVDHLSRAASWLKFNARKNDWAPADPPRNVALTILSREGEWKFKPLSGVITTPTMRPDGTILSEAGYDDQTRLLLIDPPAMPPIPDKPTREDALRSLGVIIDLLSEFPFANPASRSVAISAIITSVARGALPVAPMHVTSAPVAGSGKSFVFDVASAFSTGERAPIIAAGRTEEETEKRLNAALLNGQSIISIDNVNGELGGDLLCQAIERPIVSIRPLGSSKLVKVESRATFFATGNNIHLVGDMTRRVVLCALDPQEERPELRRFSFDPFEKVLAERGRYIAAALTICRAYAVAGYPKRLQALASFEDWSRVVRSALVWLGEADPCETMDAARADDPTATSLRVLLGTWRLAIGESYITVGKVIEKAQAAYMGERENPELYHAIHEVAETKGTLSAKRLGKFLGSQRGRIVDGMRVVDQFDDHLKQKVWSVQLVENG